MKNSETHEPKPCKHRICPSSARSRRWNAGGCDIRRQQAGSPGCCGGNGTHGDIHHPQSRRDGVKKNPLRTLAARSGMIPMFRDR